ncbi:MAG: hypothetical protein R3F35_15520 [Myxococcota bacterium]
MKTPSVASERVWPGAAPRAGGCPRVLEAFCSALLALVLASPGAAQVLVYHSPGDDGVAAPTPPILDASTPQDLNLWVDLAGSSPTQNGVVCESGDGSELCGWDFTLRASPGVGLYDFIPEPGVVALLEGRHLRVNGLHASGPSVAPVRIGRLRVVRETSSGGTVAVRGVAVAADLALEELAATTVAEIAVPEPGAGWALAMGASLLVRSARRRMRSGGDARAPRARGAGR